MKSLVFLILSLGLFCVVYSRKCQKPLPVFGFSVKKFSGSWFLVDFKPMNPTDAVVFNNSKCAAKYFHSDQGNHKRDKWLFEYINGGGNRGELRGSYYLPVPTIGNIKLVYNAGNFTYDYRILCTDYTTYYAAYVCAEVNPEYTSDLVFLFVRNLADYEKVIANKRLENCFRQVTSIKLKDFDSVPQTNCPEF